MLIRRVLVVAGAAALTASAVVGIDVMRGGAAATPTGAACTLSGTANFSSGITTTAKTVSYTFTGKLTNCRSTDTAIKTGTVSASGSGKVSCASGSTSGTSTVTWNTGTSTGVAFKTTDAGSLAAIQGNATSGEFAGAQVKGALNFITTNAAACTKAGLTSLNFTGEIGTGTP